MKKILMASALFVGIFSAAHAQQNNDTYQTALGLKISSFDTIRSIETVFPPILRHIIGLQDAFVNHDIC